jgi:hypothetical protein
MCSTHLQLRVLEPNESPIGLFRPNKFCGFLKGIIELRPLPEKRLKCRLRFSEPVASIGNHPITDKIFSSKFLVEVAERHSAPR